MTDQPIPPSSDREFVAMLVERIATDPAFRQRLLDDPASVAAILQSQSGAKGDEVAGYMRAADTECGTFTCKVSCKNVGTCEGTCSITGVRMPRR